MRIQLALKVSDLEQDLTEPSYTVETLRRVKSLEGDSDELWLMLGGDSLRDLTSWHEPEEILRLARLAVLGRPGESERPPTPEGARVDWVSGPRIRLSSTEVRERVADGRSIRFMVPEAVRAYIEAEGLYRPQRRDP